MLKMLNLILFFCKFQEWEEEMDKVQEQLKKVNGEREEDAVQIQEYNVSRVDLRNKTILW